jgi:hypothetical protein
MAWCMRRLNIVREVEVDVPSLTWNALHTSPVLVLQQAQTSPAGLVHEAPGYH